MFLLIALIIVLCIVIGIGLTIFWLCYQLFRRTNNHPLLILCLAVCALGVGYVPQYNMRDTLLPMLLLSALIGCFLKSLVSNRTYSGYFMAFLTLILTQILCVKFGQLLLLSLPIGGYGDEPMLKFCDFLLFTSSLLPSFHLWLRHNAVTKE
jgi:hypothetical protein